MHPDDRVGSGYATRPDYRVDILARRNQFAARAGDAVLASSEHCLVVDEQDHGLVVYFPREDVALDALEPVDHVTRCPFKGLATHWQLPGGAEPVAWSYEDPYPEVERIANHVAFYQQRVTVTIGVATPAVSGR
ncbi:MAG TPA: DUF427 domain-containing protein [Acidimicrobiales bacterium]|nr:DUF427 domain-containing protein [Acidimicrobiales bacterium]